MKIEVVAGDITRFPSDAIVNSANPSLLAGSGVCGAIHQAAGHELEAACRPLGPIKPGSAVITPAFHLPSKWVIHAVGPRWLGGNHEEINTLTLCYRSIVQRADENYAAHISLPSISTGIYRFPLTLASRIAISTLKSMTTCSVQRVSFICFDKETQREYLNALETG